MDLAATTGVVPIVIPAYQPPESLPVLVEQLLSNGAAAIIVVDDGSGPSFEPVFARLRTRGRVRVLRHAVNLGKGAALRTGLNFAYCEFPSLTGVVTADADGQHKCEDILAVLERLKAMPQSLVLGSRTFQGPIPWRSRIGNSITRQAVHWLAGQAISDTQTGLRGIPRRLFPHLLRLTTNGYEFELEMLMSCKHLNVAISEVPIATIYEEGNRSSHFNPLLDSFRIYFVLFRFSLLSLSTAVLDNSLFYVCFHLTASIGASQLVARTIAFIYNYLLVRRTVFLSRESHKSAFPKFVLLVFCSGLISYGMIVYLSERFGVNVFLAKIAVESVLFFANFTIERDFIFTKRLEAENE